MATIPVGNFGNAAVPVARGPQQTMAGANAIGAAVQNIGATAAGAALGLQRQQQAEREEMARAKAANALLDNELAIKQTGLAIQDEVMAGELAYADAEAAFQERVGKIQAPVIDGLDPAGAESFALGMRRQAANAALGVQAFAKDRERDDYRAQFVGGLDTLGKLAVMPGADLDQIHARARAGAPLAARAGLDQASIDRSLRDFEERNWTNRAQEQMIQAGEDVGALRQLQSSLSDADGYYLDKLDPTKRLALVKSVESQIDRIEYKAQIQADRRDAKAQRALFDMDRQIASGVPATAEMWDAWSQQVKGTSYEAEFADRTASEAEVQEVLRRPINDQIAYVQAAQAELQSAGGNMRQVANTQRLTSAVQANVKQLAESPLQFYQMRTGDTVAPIDPATLVQPGGAEVLAAQMTERAGIINGLRRQNGDLVQMRPLMPQEAQQLASVVQNATPQEQVRLFGTIRDAIGDQQIYLGAMQQIAPNSPVRAAAGMLMAAGGQQVTASPWIGPDQTVSAEKAATTMLTGEAILNKSKSESAKDGKAVSMPVPTERVFAEEFQARVGDAFAGRPQAFQAALQAVRAHYVGLSAEAGDFSADMDPGRLSESISSALGSVVTYKDSSLLLPWGMDETTFRDQFRLRMSEVLQARGLSPQQSNAEVVNFPRLDLVNFGGGEYLVLDSARRPYLVAGEPVVVSMGAQP